MPNQNSDADVEALKVNSWQTTCPIFITIVYIFRGEKSEYGNEFVVSTVRVVNTWVAATLGVL